MSIACKVINSEAYHDEQGAQINRATLAVTGLTSGGLNTVPHGLTKNGVAASPRRADLESCASGGLGVVASFDTAQGNTDPTSTLSGGKLGWDGTNFYLWIGSGGTQLMILAEY